MSIVIINICKRVCFSNSNSESSNNLSWCYSRRIEQLGLWMGAGISSNLKIGMLIIRCNPHLRGQVLSSPEILSRSAKIRQDCRNCSWESVCRSRVTNLRWTKTPHRNKLWMISITKKAIWSITRIIKDRLKPKSLMELSFWGSSMSRATISYRIISDRSVKSTKICHPLCHWIGNDMNSLM